MIVDDERRICRLISHLIDFERFGLELVGFAYDGLAALEMIKREKPQIVITDIKMPGLDGIELIKETRALGLDAHFVILSGYGTFDYARSAIRYQVDDYLLKPVNGEVLSETLEKLCGIIAAQDASRGETPPPAREQESASQRMRGYFMSNLLYNPGELRGRSLEELGAEYSMAFRPGIFRALILNMVPRELESRITVIVRQAAQLFRTAVSERCFEYESFIDKERVVIVLNYDRQLAPRMRGMLEYAFNSLVMNQELSSFVKMVLIIGDEKENCEGLYDSFQSAHRSMNLGIICGYNACYEAPAGNGFDFSLTKEHVDGLLEAVEAESEAKLLRFISGLTRQHMEELKENPAGLDSMIQLISYYIDYLATQDVTSDEFREIKMSAQFRYTVCLDIAEMERLVADSIWEIKGLYMAIRAGKQSLPVVKARRFIDQNYSKELSLEAVAGEVYLSPAYFSAVFKKEVGVNFSDYLAQVRIENAKKLLADVKYSVAEVAAAVGYPDQRYFSRVFKKQTGVNPLEFRKLQSYGLPDGRRIQ